MRFLLPSHPQSCLKCFWWKIEREALAAVQVHKNHRPQHSLCTALCVLCACSSAKFGNHWDRFSGTLYQRELFRGELPSTMPQYRLFEKQGVFAKKSSCRNTVSRKMFVSSWVRMIACHQATLSSCPQCPICCLLAPQRALTQIERCAKTGKCMRHHGTPPCLAEQLALPRTFASSSALLAFCDSVPQQNIQLLFFCSQHRVK